MKAVLDTLEGIDESLHAEYEARDGKYFLKIEGDGFAKASDLADAKTKLAEFRDRNTRLLAEVAALAGVDKAEDLSPLKDHLKRFEGIDPDEVAELKAKAEEFGKKGVKEPKDLNDQIQKALDSFKDTTVKPLQEQLEAERAARAEATERAERSLFRETVSSELSKAKAKGNALEFLVDRASSVFEVEGDKVIAKSGTFSPATGEPITIKEWAEQARKDYDFAFEPSSGSGADPGDPGNNGNPNVKTLVNPTPAQLGDPATAKALREKKLQIVNQ